MITNDQIRAIAVQHGFKLSNDAGDDLKPYVYEFARELIAMAQEVKPLVWEKSEEDHDGYVLTAYTPNGFYEILLHKQEVTLGMACEEVHEHDFESVDEAKAAAKADFASRTLANLKYGVSNA